MRSRAVAWPGRAGLDELFADAELDAGAPFFEGSKISVLCFRPSLGKNCRTISGVF